METDEALTNGGAPKRVRASRRRRWGIGFVILLLGVFLLWRTGIWTITRIQIGMVRKAGYPASLEELDRWYQSVPDSENAALTYMKAFSLLRIDSQAETLLLSERTNLLAQPVTLSEKRKEELVALLTMNAEAMQLLEGGPSPARCRYPIDFKKAYDQPMPHLKGARNGGELLLIQTLLAEGEDRSDEAVRALAGALDLSRSLAGEPDMMPELTRVALVGWTSRVLELVLSQRQFSEPQLAGLAARMHPEDFPRSLERAMAGERCMGISAFKLSAAEWFPKDMPVGARRRMLFQRVTGIWDRELSLYLSMMGESVEAARLPFPQRFAKANEVEDRISQKHDSDPEIVELAGYHSAAMMLLPPVATQHLRSAEAQARLMAAQVALAIEAYRLRNKSKLPAKLADLVPKDLATVPQDPFDGKPFRYRRLETGYVVYSVGPDGKDNEGLKKDRSKHDAPYDVVFSVAR